jgi:hypothetical protein
VQRLAVASETPDIDAKHLRHPVKLIEETTMRSLLLLFLGVPIPIIILIALFVR